MHKVNNNDQKALDLPSGWKVCSTTEACHRLWIGLVTTMTKHYVEHGTPLIRNSDIRENKINRDLIFLDNVFAKLNIGRTVKESDVITVHTGDIATSAVIPKELDGAHGFATINSRLNDTVDPLFYSYFLNSYLFKAQAYSVVTGDGRNNLNLKEFTELFLFLPPKKQQKKIASILSTIDAQIEKTEAIIAKYQAIKQGMLHDLFTRGIDTSTGQLRPAYADAPELYKPSELGMIPKEWEVDDLNYYIEKLEAGVSVNSEDKPASFNEIGILKTSALSGCKFSPEQNKTVIKNEINRVKCSVRGNTILISRMNTPDLVGENAYVDQDFSELFVPDRLWQTLFKRNVELNVYLLSALLSSKSYRDKISFLATGTSNSMKNITKEDFLSINIPLIDICEQNLIASIYKANEKSILSNQHSLHKLQLLKQGLMSDLLSGKVEVTVNKTEPSLTS